MTRLVSPGAIVGRYRLADFLGAGGMGEVYRATHLVSGQVVAIKILTAPEIEARWLARVYHEARVQQALNHPNIARLYELVDLQGRPCLVLEYIGGESLADRLERQRRLPPREALRILQAIAWAVAYVHAQGIVHRDLKPGNVRVTPEGQIKLLDFGISKSRHAEGLTQTGNVIGTPRYLAPEQLLGDPITPATDVWALGVLLHEMVTGEPPFAGESDALLWARIDRATYVAPSAIVSPAPEDVPLMRQVDRIVATCLTRQVGRRPTAEALAAAAGEALASSDRVSAGARALTPISRPMQPIQSWIERHWMPISAASIALPMVALALWLALGGQGRMPSGGGGGGRPGGTGTGPQLPADSGLHRIDVVSGRADVIVNGKPLGSTPVDYVGPIGETVAVELRQPGFEPLQEQIQITTTGTSTFMMRRSRALP
jgi:serine/threonine-protein kinase